MRHCASLVSMALLLTVLAGRGSARGEESARKPFQPMDVFQLEYASDPQISPDGKTVVYVRNFMDVMKDRKRSNLWSIRTDGTEHRPLTSGTRNDSSPRWSPDGTRLVYLANDGTNSEVVCRWMDSGQTARLVQNASEPGDFSWSPDGKHIAFTMFVPSEKKPYAELPAKPTGAEWAELPKVIQSTLYRADGKGYLKDGYHHIFVVPAEGGTPTPLTDGPYHHHGPLAWFPDSKSLVFSANRNVDWEKQPEESELYEVTVADRKIAPLTDRKGPDYAPAISSKGEIAWLGYDHKQLSHQVSKLHLMSRDSRKPRVLIGDLERNSTPAWNAKGDTIYLEYDKEGTTVVASVSPKGDARQIAAGVGGVTIGRPYSSGTFSVSGEGVVAFTSTTPDRPADVSVVVDSGEPRQLTHLNEDLFGQRALASTEEFWFESSFDKQRIQAWLVTPPGFDATKKYPLLLEIHGGPFANYGSRFSAEIQLYAAAGYVVLYVNPRGSTGYGEKFANLIHHDYPGHDFDDLMSGVDAVIKRGFIDEENQFVTGGSGGGILTAWIVGHTDRFRAAVSQKPVINWHSFVLTTDNYPFFADVWFPGTPWEALENYQKRSPLTYVDKVKTPTMLMTGEQDYRTPISEAEQFFQALKLRGVDTALVRIPDASHDTVARPSRIIVQTSYIVKWFETYRKKADRK
ncbi:MAG: S9 family peptidase [Planctomycetaceae bacterium]|nr:S9 family peptidase [Planctomycetaceae bacterium]